jgi:hypothetical protein
VQIKFEDKVVLVQYRVCFRLFYYRHKLKEKVLIINFFFIFYQAENVFRGVRDESQEAPEVPHGSGDKTGRRKIFVGSFGKKIPS